MAETQEMAVKPKPRPIIRLGLLLISHSFLVSIVCCTAGVVALLLLPVLAKNTYISENALMPGSASSMLSSEDVSEANKFVNKILSLDPSSMSTEIPRLIAQHMTDLGSDVNYHKFQPQLQKFRPLHFFSGPDPGLTQENNSYSSFGLNTVGIIRAPRGDGKEAIVLVTPYNALKVTPGEALSLGIGYSVFSLLSRVTWLAKDIIWLAADSQHGEYAAVSEWLRTYHTPVFGGSLSKLDSEIRNLNIVESKTSRSGGIDAYDDFRRAGTMAAALVIKVADDNVNIETDALSIYAEASNGQMPNLDLINIVNYLAVHGQGLRVRVDKVWSLLDSWWLKDLGGLIESLGKVARSLNPQWKFGISVAEYVEGTATLASSLYNQALGVPTGPHGAFRDYQVDSITMEISHRLLSNNKVRSNDFLLRNGRLVEGVVRSINNLLEKFHQSFFLYLLTSPNKFISVGVYMIAFLLLIAPLPLAAASLFSDASNSNSSTEKDQVSSRAPEYESWKWLQAAKLVFVMQLWGVTVTLIPQLLYRIPSSSPLSSLLIWAMLSALSLLILQSTLGSYKSSSTTHPRETEWALLKSVTIAAAFIGLCLMSVINFATAELGALLLVPLCLVVMPLRLSFRIKNLKSFMQGVCSLGSLILAFPPVAYFVLKGALEGYDNIRIDDFWSFVESLWAWNSATYIYICMVHLPCWALCIITLVHPC